MGADPLRREGQPGLRAPLGDLPGHRHFPHGAEHQLHRRRPARRARSPQGSGLEVIPSDLCFVSATGLRHLYRTRQVSPLEVMQAVFARIDAVNPALNAYVTLARESALAEARKATAALKRSAPK